MSCPATSLAHATTTSCPYMRCCSCWRLTARLGSTRQRPPIAWRVGPNVLPSLRRHGPLVRFLLQFHHPLVYVLLAAAVTALLAEVVDASGDPGHDRRERGNRFRA